MQNIFVSQIKSFASPQLISNSQTLKQMEGTHPHLKTNFKKCKNMLNQCGVYFSQQCNNKYYKSIDLIHHIYSQIIAGCLQVLGLKFSLNLQEKTSFFSLFSNQKPNSYMIFQLFSALYHMNISSFSSYIVKVDLELFSPHPHHLKVPSP